MKVSATEFKANCLALIDRVRTKGDSITITKRGKVVARLVPDRDLGVKPWLACAARCGAMMTITPDIAMEVARLPGTVRRDPADPIIVATARVHHLPLVTVDRVMLDSGLIKEWRA